MTKSNFQTGELQVRRLNQVVTVSEKRPNQISTIRNTKPIEHKQQRPTVSKKPMKHKFRTHPIAKRETANGRNRFLQKSAVFCGFLRKSAVSCGFLRKSATPKSLDLQSEKISENQRKSAKMCVPGPVSPFCCLPRWGVQKRFWGGVFRRIYGMFSTPLSFPPPLAAL